MNKTRLCKKGCHCLIRQHLIKFNLLCFAPSEDKKQNIYSQIKAALCLVKLFGCMCTRYSTIQLPVIFWPREAEMFGTLRKAKEITYQRFFSFCWLPSWQGGEDLLCTEYKCTSPPLYINPLFNPWISPKYFWNIFGIFLEYLWNVWEWEKTAQFICLRKL